MSIAYVGRIERITEIENADFLQSAVVNAGAAGTWTGVVRKEDFQPGDLVEVYLPDAVVPNEWRFAFMKPHNYRVRVARFRGAPSECLIMPMTITGEVGDDIAQQVGATKYEKPVPVEMSGQVEGAFPSFIPKTDEPNFQVVPEMVDAIIENGWRWFATEKADGTSATAYYHNGHLGVCSRNWELKEGDNIYWRMVHKHGIAYLLRDLWEQLGISAALQFEIVGPGIQGNPMDLTDNSVRAFDLYDIGTQRYFDRYGLEKWCRTQIPVVPIVAEDTLFPGTREELYKLAEGTYPCGSQREGIVIRTRAERWIGRQRLSFKVLNLLYKG